jgi:hypothetical protein
MVGKKRLISQLLRQKHNSIFIGSTIANYAAVMFFGTRAIGGFLRRHRSYPIVFQIF